MSIPSSNVVVALSTLRAPRAKKVLQPPVFLRLELCRMFLCPQPMAENIVFRNRAAWPGKSGVGVEPNRRRAGRNGISARRHRRGADATARKDGVANIAIDRYSHLLDAVLAPENSPILSQCTACDIRLQKCGLYTRSLGLGNPLSGGTFRKTG